MERAHWHQLRRPAVLVEAMPLEEASCVCSSSISQSVICVFLNVLSANQCIIVAEHVRHKNFPFLPPAELDDLIKYFYKKYGSLDHMPVFYCTLKSGPQMVRNNYAHVQLHILLVRMG